MLNTEIGGTFMQKYTRTDLACESPRPRDGRGVVFREYGIGSIRCEEMTVSAGDGERVTGRPAGRYATLHCGKIWELDREASAETAEAAAELLGSFLAAGIGGTPKAGHGILIAGLGNRFITADSVGPRTADLVTVTNHAAGEDTLLGKLGCSRVSALAPGVLGQTGLEAASLIAEAAVSAGADVIIAVDALAARSTERLGTTIQISDAGIRPGSGIGNHRAAITRESMGIPVIALGVPTVVDSSTLILDALTRAEMDTQSESLEKILKDGRSFIVSPRESDLIAAAVADVLSGALNRVLTPALL